MAANIAVFGIYRSREQADEAIGVIRDAGFRNEDISVLLPDNQGTKDFAHEKNTKAPEGTTAGAAAGGILGGALGWLAGAGALAIPGIGPFLAAGPILGALAGLGAGGVVGGFVGAIVGMGIPEYEAKRYEGRIRAGGVLCSIHCDDEHWVSRAKKILQDTGAEDIASAGEEKADYKGTRSEVPLDRTPGS
ncbi:MAG TPA: general stress protein [Bryobacteraceae bacterium]|nr:general stress protein [Bryobacteraceae bacterium]